MRTIISLTLGMVAALFGALCELVAFGSMPGWLPLILFVSVYVMTLHRLTMRRRFQ